MTTTFDRRICSDLNETISREWLVTNGLGGYAAGTVAGALTRMQHGLLVAAPPGAETPQLLLAKIDEEVVFDQRTYYLGTNEYRDGTLNPAGFVHLESFRLEEGSPIFTYRLGGLSGITLEKRIWMPHGLNTTYIQYRVQRNTTSDGTGYRRDGSTEVVHSSFGRQQYSDISRRTMTLTLLPFTAQRPYNIPQHGSKDRFFHVDIHRADELTHRDTYMSLSIAPHEIIGCTIQAGTNGYPYHMLAAGQHTSYVTFIPTGVWYWNFLRRCDLAAGLPATDDLYLPGVIRTTFMLEPERTSSLTIIASSEKLSSLAFYPEEVALSYNKNIERQRHLLSNALQPRRYFGDTGEAVHAQHLHILQSQSSHAAYDESKEFLLTLLQAADRFVIRHVPISRRYDPLYPEHDEETVPSVLSSYYGMELKTRETLIAFPGLLLIPGHYAEARTILRQLVRSLRGGLLPDRFPVNGELNSSLKECDYGNVDGTLWLFYALDHYLQVTRDAPFLREIYFRLTESIDRYIYGTMNGIQIDAHDGLLRAGCPGKALTWMNATIQEEPVTPRVGKPVEVNALWYNALSLLQSWSLLLQRQGATSSFSPRYEDLLKQCERSFGERFWNETGDYLFDVVDGVNGNDPAIRPNQLFALSLHYPVLHEDYRRSVFDVVTRHLLTAYGLRTLAPLEHGYRGHAGPRLEEQQRALHQGSTWIWLLGPYIEAMLSLPPTHAGRLEELHSEYLWLRGKQLLEISKGRLNVGLLTMYDAVLDGDGPSSNYLDNSSAMSTGEMLRIYDLLSRTQVSRLDRYSSKQ
jgi:glycogen debranching enzyme